MQFIKTLTEEEHEMHEKFQLQQNEITLSLQIVN